VLVQVWFLGVCLSLAFCVFIWFSLDDFVLVALLEPTTKLSELTDQVSDTTQEVADARIEVAVLRPGRMRRSLTICTN